MFVTFYGSKVHENLVLRLNGKDTPESQKYVSDLLSAASRGHLVLNLPTAEGFHLLTPHEYPCIAVGAGNQGRRGDLILDVSAEDFVHAVQVAAESLRKSLDFPLED